MTELSTAPTAEETSTALKRRARAMRKNKGKGAEPIAALLENAAEHIDNLLAERDGYFQATKETPAEMAARHQRMIENQLLPD